MTSRNIRKRKATQVANEGNNGVGEPPLGPDPMHAPPSWVTDRAARVRWYVDALALRQEVLDVWTAKRDALAVEARLEGVTWDELGEALGITRQAAAKRYTGESA